MPAINAPMASVARPVYRARATAASTPSAFSDTTVLIGFLVGVVVASSVLIAGALLDLVYADRIYPHVRVLDRDLGGLTVDQARLVLKSVEATALARSVRVAAPDRQWTATLAELGARLDLDRTAEAALRSGREHPLTRLTSFGLATTVGWHVDPVITDDPERRDRAVVYLGAVLDRPVIDARYAVTADGAVDVLPEQIGRRVDTDDFTRQVSASAGGHSTEPIALRIVDTPPAVTAADLQSVRETAASFLSAPVTLTYGAEQWAIQPAQLAEVLTLPPGRRGGPATLRLAPDRLSAQVEVLAKQVNRPAREAKFRYKGGSVLVTQESQDGLQVDVAATVQAITDAFERAQHTVPIVAQVDAPKLASAERDRIVLRDRLAYGIGNYGGGLPERLQNVELAAKRLDGTLVPPGAIFSFNESLGPATLESGFKWGFGIASDGNGGLTTVPSEAGGICQVATTLFQAAFRAGLMIEERNGHSYWIPRYGASESGMIGLDSTVDDPSLDLKFRNNTGNWLAVSAAVDPSRSILAFEIRGVDPGWKVKIDGPVITDVKKANLDIVYQESDNLPYGEIWVEAAQDGFTAAITRTVSDASGKVILGPSKFVSVYQPARNVKLVRKGNVPAGAAR